MILEIMFLFRKPKGRETDTNLNKGDDVELNCQTPRRGENMSF